jgi:hypothetical protein
MIYDPGVIMLCLDFRGQGLSLSCHVLFERLKLRFRLFLTENRKYFWSTRKTFFKPRKTKKKIRKPFFEFELFLLN